MRASLLLLLLMTYAAAIFGQKPSGNIPKDTRLGFQARAYGDSVVIRLAPASRKLWRVLTDYGSTLKRFELSAQSPYEPIAGSEVQLLTDSLPLGPLMNPDVVKARLQRLLGTGKPVMTQPGDTLVIYAMQVFIADYADDVYPITTTDEEMREQRETNYLAGLMLANRSTVAADILGMRFVDKTARRGKSYYYVLTSMAYPDSLVYDLRVTNVVKPKPKIRDAFIEELDGRVVVGISKRRNEYLGYWLERAEGKTGVFEPMYSMPMSPEQSTGSDNPDERMAIGKKGQPGYREIQVKDYAFFIDSVKNYVPMRYRIRGQTLFAETTEPLVLTGMGRDLTPPPAPLMARCAILEDKFAHLEWDFEPDVNLKDIKGIKIKMATSRTGEFKEVLPGLILPASARSYNVPGALSSDEPHHFTAITIDANGNENMAIPVFLHVPDETPPAMPSGVKYTIDTSGILRISWAANSEKDVDGYRIFQANRAGSDGQYAMRSQQPVMVPEWNDTFHLKKTLQRVVYYKVCATDWAGNMSAPALLSVRLPDMVPPVPPVLRNLKPTKEGIGLEWINSGSEDVRGYRIFRRTYGLGDTAWVLLKEMNDLRTTTWIDTSAALEMAYDYTMAAVDSAGWVSKMTFPASGRRFFDAVVMAPSGLTAVFDSEQKQVNLNWTFTPPQTDGLRGKKYFFHLYRAAGNDPLTMYRQIPQTQLTYMDKEVKSGNYRYALKVVFENSKSSDMTAPVQLSTK